MQVMEKGVCKAEPVRGVTVQEPLEGGLVISNSMVALPLGREAVMRMRAEFERA